MNIKDQKGAAIVEFALILPLLLILLFGIIEFSLLLYNKAMITNASREGARYGIVYETGPGPDGILGNGDDTFHPNTADIKNRVKNYASNFLITFGSDTLDDNSIGVCVDVVGVCDSTVNHFPENASSGAELTVNATYLYDFLVFPRLTALSNIQTLEAVTKMRFE
jgi:hypothetical protein